jgi:hypothetical protein
LPGPSATASGQPLPSTARWYLLEGRPRFTGLGPTRSPPFSRRRSRRRSPASRGRACRPAAAPRPRPQQLRPNPALDPLLQPAPARLAARKAELARHIHRAAAAGEHRHDPLQTRDRRQPLTAAIPRPPRRVSDQRPDPHPHSFRQRPRRPPRTTRRTPLPRLRCASHRKPHFASNAMVPAFRVQFQTPLVNTAVGDSETTSRFGSHAEASSKHRVAATARATRSARLWRDRVAQR